jgi:molybdenum cofactor cytidylyltransferase
MPWLEPATIDALLAAFADSPEAIVVPLHEGRRGHPIVVPWTLASEVLKLAGAESLKTLVERRDVRTVECNDTVLGDLDTPEEYEAARRRYGR